jgi:hypothetical protein
MCLALMPTMESPSKVTAEIPINLISVSVRTFEMYRKEVTPETMSNAPKISQINELEQQQT